MKFPALSLASAALALIAPLVAAPASAADASWPAKQVRIVVGFAPGGTTDLAARIVADGLSKSLGQPVVVENKPGAGGNIGAQEVARAAPDGYTFFMGTPGTQAINQFLYSKMPYDTQKDFAPVSFVIRVPNVLMVHPSVKADDLKGLIALMKANPTGFSYGTPGNGSTGHLSTELFKTMAGVQASHVPYRGSGPMLQDLMGGQVQMAIDNLPSAMPHIKAGKLKALGVTSSDAAESLPSVPPIGSVVPGYAAESWFVLMAPAATPAPIVERVSREIDTMLKQPETRERFAKLGATVVGGTPKALGDFLAGETSKWQKVVKDSGAKID
ncbi:MAG: Bug family tripartite tricarboxylate transporter substrate binding protein [Lautropia sp.]